MTIQNHVTSVAYRRNTGGGAVREFDRPQGSVQARKGRDVSVKIEEIRSCQALLLEYMAFFLAERRGVDLRVITAPEAYAMEADIDRLVTSNDPGSEGPDIGRLIGEWRGYEEQARLEGAASETGAKGKKRSRSSAAGEIAPAGWLLRALERRRLRSPVETPAPH